MKEYTGEYSHLGYNIFDEKGECIYFYDYPFESIYEAQDCCNYRGSELALKNNAQWREAECEYVG